VISPQVLYVEDHDGNEWVTVSYRRWWWPWFRVNEKLFSGVKWDHMTFSNERGRSFTAGWLRNLITIYEAEQKKVTKLLEAHDLPEGAVSWNGKLTKKDYTDGLWFEPEEGKVNYHSWLIHIEGIPSAWIEHRVRITMEVLP
jgi:hypothetical protein